MDRNATLGLESYAPSAPAIATRPIRILIADDHATLRQALRRVLEGVPGVELLEEAGLGKHSFEISEAKADVVLSDVDLAAAISYYSSIRECQEHGCR